jgi:DNA segregation ATPase FtsK/SpoIIIE, S-DNA-T family
MSELISKIDSIQDKYRMQLDEVKKLEAFDFYSDYLLKNKGKSKLPEFIKVGNLISETINYPALIPLQKIKGLAFELNDSNREEINLTIEHIALQIMNQIDAQYFQFTIIDPKKLGSNFQHLRRLDSKVIGNVVFEEEEIRKSISYHFNESVKVVNECLIHYNSIEDYNKQTGEKQSFRFIFISDFPYGFKDSLDKLNTILHNNSEAGVFVFMTYDTTIDIGTYQDKVKEVVKQLSFMQEFGNPANDFYKIQNIPREDFYNDKFTLKLDRADINPEKLNLTIREILNQSKQDINFEPTDGLRIPIGKVAGQTHYFTIGHETDNYHGIIGGQPGKGKTILLNNIIAKGIETYNSEELKYFLIDCAGVGFQEFKHSIHIQELCSSSNVEVCVESVKKLEEEMLNREMLFKNNNVAELKDYIKKTGSKLPRIICIIDEFHVLFTGSSRISSYVETVLVDKVIRIGRKFGIHLLVSTQSLGGGVRKSILDNIPLRIALGMTEDQSSGFLGFKNEAAANLERGVAIYNNQNGAIKANKTVRVNYLDFNDIEQIIQSSLNK